MTSSSSVPLTPPIVRFAPSPTGSLHIGSARTALFNALFARHYGGTFLLRIEDTDRVRSTPEAVHTILDGLSWLGLAWDGEPISQASRVARHQEVAHALLARGHAYRCYCTPDELTAMREAQKAAGLPLCYDGRWRDRPESDAPHGKPFALRIKMPREGSITVDDQVMGTITVPAEQLDDFVILRSDGTPTYMLAVVVDDHDMGITHVIRGDDHLTNTVRQLPIFHAMDWPVPVFAHLPMILGQDGAKLSKRHGAPAVGDYREMGYLPEALNNYLLRLCWAHGDDEIIDAQQAIAWFTLDGIGRSPARVDVARLDNLNAHYLKQADDARLAELATPFVERASSVPMRAEIREQLIRLMPDLKPRAKTLRDIAEGARFLVMTLPLAYDDKARALLTHEACGHLHALRGILEALPVFDRQSIEEAARTYATQQGMKLGALAQPLRAALTGTTVSPPIFTLAEILGREEVVRRMRGM